MGLIITEFCYACNVNVGHLLEPSGQTRADIVPFPRVPRSNDRRRFCKIGPERRFTNESFERPLT